MILIIDGFLPLQWLLFYYLSIQAGFWVGRRRVLHGSEIAVEVLSLAFSSFRQEDH
jgi:ABC-type Co2+ transport system permease subunit